MRTSGIRNMLKVFLILSLNFVIILGFLVVFLAITISFLGK